MKTDAVTIEVLSTKLRAAAEEMGFALQRSGRTLYVKETADFCTGISNLEGKLVAYPGCVGVSSGIDVNCKPTIDAGGELKPGDVLATNHPYLSGGLATHLPDIHLIKPYYYKGELFGYGWSFVHSADVGGRVPSSISPSNTELFQEGLLIPPMKLCREGVLNEDMLAFIGANTRTAEENIGDIKAMLAALQVGERRIQKIIHQHGLDVYKDGIQDVVSYSSAKARAAFRTIPDGDYEFCEYLDDDLISPIPVRMHAKMSVRDGLIHLDFAGTDPQVAAAFNLATGGNRHSAVSLRLVSHALTQDPTIPLNHGLLEPITMNLPTGTLLHPIFPASVGVRHVLVVRLNDLIGGLIAQALPETSRSCGGGTTIPVVFAEPPDAAGKRNVIVVEPMIGGTGAQKGTDGIDARDSGTHNMCNNPLELVETTAAISIHRYGIRMDSGGAGCWRGGVGLELTFSPLHAGSIVLGRGMDRFRFEPWGLVGGGCGVNARTILNYGRQDEKELGKIDMVELGPADTITIMTPGGGGYGDPLEREADLVMNDVERGFVSAEMARSAYGVAIASGSVDVAETRELREVLRARKRGHETAKRGIFEFGPNRLAWESVFDDRMMQRINAVLAPLSPAARRLKRQTLLAPLVELLTASSSIPQAALAHAALGVEKSLLAMELAAS